MLRLAGARARQNIASSSYHEFARIAVPNSFHNLFANDIPVKRQRLMHLGAVLQLSPQDHSILNSHYEVQLETERNDKVDAKTAKEESEPQVSQTQYIQALTLDVITTRRPREEALKLLQAYLGREPEERMIETYRGVCCIAGALIHLDQLPSAYDYLKANNSRTDFSLGFFGQYVLSALHQKSREDWVPTFVSLAQERSTIKHPLLVHSLAKTYVRFEEYAKLDRLLRQCKLDGIKLQQKTLEVMIKGFQKNGDMIAVKKAVDQMVSQGMTLKESSIAAIVGENCYAEADISRMVHDTPNIHNLNLLLRLHLKSYNYDKFDQTVQRIRFDNSEDANPRQPRPNLRTWLLLLKSVSRRQQGLDKTIDLLTQFTESGTPSHSSLVRALMRAYMDAGETLSAIHLLSSICQSHPRYTEDILPFLSALHHLAASNQPHSPNPIIHPLDVSAVRLDIYILNTVLRELTGTFGLQAATPILQIMKFFRINPDGETATHVVKAAAHISDRPGQLIYLAEHLTDPRPFKKINKLGAPAGGLGAPLTLSLQNYLHNRILFKEQHRLLAGYGWVPQRRRSRSRIPLRTADTTEYTSPTAGMQIERMSRLTTILKTRGVRSNHHAYYLRLRREGVNQGDMGSAMKVFARMRKEMIKPRLTHYRALALGHAMQGNPEGIKQCIREYEQQVKTSAEVESDPSTAQKVLHVIRMGVGVGSIVLWSLLVLAYGKLGRPDLAQASFEEMINEGIIPDPLAVQRLAQSHFINGDAETARQSILKFWPAHAVGALTHEISRLPLKRLSKLMMEKQQEMSGNPGQKGTYRRKLSPKEVLEMEATMERILEIWRSPDGKPNPQPPSSPPQITRREPPDDNDEGRVHRDLGGRMAPKWQRTKSH